MSVFNEVGMRDIRIKFGIVVSLRAKDQPVVIVRSYADCLPNRVADNRINRAVSEAAEARGAGVTLHCADVDPVVIRVADARSLKFLTR
jgi:hypothetical protein